ncbi:MAG TPA: ABC transporter ATP-binding protein [Pyrinomonadaceae bacterium]
MKPETLLDVRELRKAYASPSGAGKSTLLHLLGGLDTADGGDVRLGETKLTRMHGAELARVRNEKIGFVFQFHHLLPDLSALENVALPLLVARRKPREARAAAAAMLRAVGLSERASHRPGELSGGEQQRAAIARALVHEPRLVLADEPTGNLDARTGAGIAALLSTLARTRGAGIVVATHNEQLAEACDRTLVLRDGRLGEN